MGEVVATAAAIEEDEVMGPGIDPGTFGLPSLLDCGSAEGG